MNSLHGAVNDKLGFTPLELTHLLGKYDSQQQFLVHKKGEMDAQILSCIAFEDFFKITYRPHLYFPSYEALKTTVQNCPYILRSKTLASENHAWWKSFGPEISQGKTAPLLIKWISNEMGYGAFTESDLSLGDFVGEYTGLVRPLLRRHPDHNEYCFHYPTRLWSLKYTVIDALHNGNTMRFVNHSNHPNLLPLCVINKNLLHLVFVAAKNIPKGTQLTFNYGNDFWKTRTGILTN